MHLSLQEQSAIGSLDLRGSISSSAHTERVLTYFKTAGLPVDQIDGTSVSTAIQEEGVVGLAPSKRSLVGFTSVVHRKIAGVRVEDSFAWAMFNKSDVPIFEQVWWPDLPAAILAEIDAFKAEVSGGGFRARLPREYADAEGRLVVHHATPSGESWHARVTFDVRERVSRGGSHHFDIDGREVRVEWNLGPHNVRR